MKNKGFVVVAVFPIIGLFVLTCALIHGDKRFSHDQEPEVIDKK